MFCIQIFSFCTGLSVNNYYHVRFPVCLWFTYGSLRWTGAVWQSEPVHLDELVWTHTVITFIYIHFAVKEVSKWRNISKWKNSLNFGMVWKRTNFSHIMNPSECFQEKCNLNNFLFHLLSLTWKNHSNLSISYTYIHE